MRRQFPARLLPVFFALSIGAVPGVASAAFFQLAEQSVSGLGNAFAGGAASAHDASTVWYNPAGLIRMKESPLTGAVHSISPSLRFEDQGSAITALVGAAALTGGEGGDAGENAFIPNFYYIRPVNNRLSFGVGLNVPFGLRTEYDDGWKGRYHALESEIETININPAVGYKVNDKLSIGGGVSVQQIDATLTNAVDFGTICVLQLGGGCPLVPQGADGEAKLTADGTGFGYNFGVLWQAGERTRVGFHHRSAVRHELEGDAKFKNVPALFAASPTFSNQGIEAEITLPATNSISVYHELNDRWAIMGDVTQTRWGRLPELRIDFDLPGVADSVVTLDLDDVLRYSLGATLRPGGHWVYRFGVAVDETPTPNAVVRTARLPDEDRTWVTFGASYKRNNRLSFDFAYAFIDAKTADIAKNANSATSEDLTRGNLVGEFEADTGIISAQANWKF